MLSKRQDFHTLIRTCSFYSKRTSPSDSTEQLKPASRSAKKKKKKTPSHSEGQTENHLQPLRRQRQVKFIAQGRRSNKKKLSDASNTVTEAKPEHTEPVRLHSDCTSIRIITNPSRLNMMQDILNLPTRCCQMKTAVAQTGFLVLWV